MFDRNRAPSRSQRRLDGNPLARGSDMAMASTQRDYGSTTAESNYASTWCANKLLRRTSDNFMGYEHRPQFDGRLPNASFAIPRLRWLQRFECKSFVLCCVYGQPITYSEHSSTAQQARYISSTETELWPERGSGIPTVESGYHCWWHSVTI